MRARRTAVHRAFAVLLLLALASLLALGVGLPLWSASTSYDARLAEQQRLLAHYRRIAAGREALEQQAQHLRRWQSSSNLYLRANTEALAAAELQGLVKQQAGVSGGRVLSAQTLPATRDGVFKRVAVKVRVRTDMDGLLQTLYGLRSRRPVMFVDDLSIRSLSSRRRDPASGELVEFVELDMTLEVSSYMREPTT